MNKCSNALLKYELDRKYGMFNHIEMYNIEDGNKLLKEVIAKGNPCSIIRPGTGECAHLVAEDSDLNRRKYRIERNEYIYFGGMGESEEQHSKRMQEFRNTIINCDIMGVINVPSVRYVVRNYTKRKKVFDCVMLSSMTDFFGRDDWWFTACEGKKVLFISPFVEQMQSQWEIIDKIWDGKLVFPNIDAKWLKSVWFMNKMEQDGDFDCWEEAKDYLVSEMKKIDFDIVIVSASMFSTFLVDEAKRMGKIGLQYGGALQLLFGIKGARWEREKPELYNSWYNEYWIRPPKPNMKNLVKGCDDGCYW